jgi:Uma2 family endonuclease
MAVETSAPFLRMIWPDEMAELDLAPLQGLWTVDQYLTLTNQTNHLIEFTDGMIEVLPMPTEYHQAISKFLSRQSGEEHNP